MSQIREIMENYRQAHERLRNPPNAVPDTPINLRKSREPTPCKPVAEPIIEEPVVIDYPSFSPFQRTDLTFSSILRFTAKEYHISFGDIRAHQRIQMIAFPRQIAVWIAYKNKIQSLSGMGRYLHMDHTTIIHARQKIQLLFDKNAMFKRYILSLEVRLLAAFDRTSLPALSQPYLDTEETKGIATI